VLRGIFGSKRQVVTGLKRLHKENFIIYKLQECHLGDQIIKNDVGWACTEVWTKNVMGGDHMGD
jgi:hypothetical protein